MHTWDLLPPQCRERFERRRRVRRWAVAYATVIATLGVLGGGLVAHTRGERVRRDDLDERVRQHWLRNEEASELYHRITRLQADITRYNRLAWPVRVSDAVAALAGVTPERAVLTALTLAPYEEQARRGGAEGEGPTSWLAIEISGVAPSDAEVASMVSGLEDHPLFAAVKLEFARSRDMDEALFREFRLRCEIDLSRQYLLVDAGEGEGVLP